MKPGDSKEYQNMPGFNSLQEYSRLTALHFSTRFGEHLRDLPGLQAVVPMTGSMLNSPSYSHSNDQ